MHSWFWLAISASTLWGLSYVIGQRLLTLVNPLQLIWSSSLIICVSLSIYLTLRHQWGAMLEKITELKSVNWLIIYAVLYFIASLLILKSIDKGNASLAAIIESSYPLFTLFFSYLLLNQTQFNPGIIVGVILIIAGISVVNIYSQ